MSTLSNKFSIVPAEIDITAVASQGSGGQNVNKVATAVHLRFNIRHSSLPDDLKERLLQLADRRITRDGIIVIKSQQSRSLEQNRTIAIERLIRLISSVATIPKERKPTKPTLAARARRLEEKAHRSRIKSSRGRPSE